MKSLSKKLFTGILISLILLSQSLACTAITLVNKKGDVVSGRTMEWALNWNWQLIYIPKGTQHYLTAPSNIDLPKQEYKSKYSVLATGLSKDGQTLVIDGQNSQGLSLSANYLPGFTKYQTVNKNDPKYASIIESTTLILSQYSNVNEVRQALEKYKIWSDKSIMIDGISPEVHFLITDKNGAGLVVEYIDGKAKFYNVNSNVKVMTNAPTYDWQLLNLKNYLSLDNRTPTNLKISDAINTDKHQRTVQDISGFLGGGLLGIPGDYSPPSRFVRVAAIGYYANNKAPENDADLVSKVTHILHNVDIPKGVVADELQGKKMFDHTAYVVIKDLNDNKLYISTYNHPNNPVVVDLNTLDKDNSKGFDIILEKLPFPNNDITNKLVEINKN
ncbi:MULTISPECIES: linear amide C-N hydrolase [unclassified Francisella]|uniref:linear amide C-N hydrolase n=1 Tax=unclassified Francisella TaxID=2610885 RepID=UPI002E376520|nr:MULTISPECIES: linear amide C-N hydrolase [unclassified Francisella]MED7819236.1 linear amide C-N hydrolase [Francisella sp. 19S2-4]MED7830025.1 linear amide C-N hydrolase [Francisella sp. 19S2-10]